MTKRAVRVRLYPILRQAVESGCDYASHRFFKHLDVSEPMETIDREELAARFADEVMNELSEVIDYGDEE